MVNVKEQRKPLDVVVGCRSHRHDPHRRSMALTPCSYMSTSGIIDPEHQVVDLVHLGDASVQVEGGEQVPSDDIVALIARSEVGLDRRSIDDSGAIVSITTASTGNTSRIPSTSRRPTSGQPRP